uniref:TRAP transporter large permease subunit n=1 Tax=Enterobacter hormaechei TaxID=158836 RepID=UPI0013D721B1
MMIIISALVFFGLLVLGLDVGFAMILAALMGMMLNGAIDPVMAPLTLVSGVDSAALITVPLFVLAGEIMN